MYVWMNTCIYMRMHVYAYIYIYIPITCRCVYGYICTNVCLSS